MTTLLLHASSGDRAFFTAGMCPLCWYLEPQPSIHNMIFFGGMYKAVHYHVAMHHAIIQQNFSCHNPLDSNTKSDLGVYNLSTCAAIRRIGSYGKRCVVGIFRFYFKRGIMCAINSPHHHHAHARNNFFFNICLQ